MNNRKKCVYIILCIITFIQISIYFKKDDDTIEVISTNNYKIKKSFKDIDIELNNIEKLEVLELKDNNDFWSGKILLTVTREEIFNSIELLKEYSISNYKIDGNINEFQVLLDIYR